MVCQLGAETKVGCGSMDFSHGSACWGESCKLTDLDVTLCVHENVVGLDVSMDNVLIMQVLETFARL